ncbi:MAG: glucans biosynthesis glucosyltransferase MdoH [Rhodospirillaceae bacterium]|nr:glucans biosynthesis glucosyltransferase MdoH [Rhodospirillaceae bacterium]
MKRPLDYRIQAWLRRGALALLTLATTGWAAAQLSTVLAGNHGLGALEILLLALFVGCFLWIAFSFWAAIAGFAMLVARARQPGLTRAPADPGPLRSRTAIVMAIYNEEPARVFANIQAIYESVKATGQGQAFDFYMVSDTTDPDIWIAEELAWHALTQRLGADARVFYRRRRKNTAKKAGNIADFCRRWGRHYDYMVVLDADSLMEGATLVAMARLMDANPGAGLIQAPPVCINRNTLFARMLQFAGRVYGPVFAAGQAFWQMGEGNYWGHNAIIRVRPFIEHCGLPELPGKPPFGGHIMSHDFVEAALLVRAGWSVWLVPELGGSYEEVPPTLLDYAKRDHRWCQGNLQHARILPARGLNPVSRFHFVGGIMSYMASPLWLAFLGFGLLIATVNTLFPRAYFGEQKQLFPDWPIFDAALAQSLFVLALGFLLVPRILGVALTLADGPTRRAAGGGVRVVVGTVIELVYSTLLAPAMMLFQSNFVVKTLLGGSIGWATQNRDDAGIPWPLAFRAHLGHMLLGLGVGVLAFAIDPQLFLWLSPLVAGLVLAVPLAQFSSRRDFGAWLRKRRLFLIPEETVPPPVLVRARDLFQSLQAEPRGEEDALRRVLADPIANAVHRLLLAATEEESPPESAELFVARRKLANGQPLNNAEKALLLYDRPTLDVARPVPAMAA